MVNTHSNDDAGFAVRVNRELRDNGIAVLRAWRVENRAVMEAVFETLKHRPSVLFAALEPDWPDGKDEPQPPAETP